MKRLLLALFLLAALTLPMALHAPTVREALAQTGGTTMTDAGTIPNDDSPPTGEVAVDGNGGGLSAASFGNAAVTTDPQIPQQFDNWSWVQGLSTTHFNNNYPVSNWRVQLLLCKQDVDGQTRDCGENNALRGSTSLQLYTQHFTLRSGTCVYVGSPFYYYTKARIQKNTASGWDTKLTGISHKGVSGYSCNIS